ncbi:enoyl-CoA hydratase/isomerase family protein [Bradyrhizobium canariense]|uniref:Short chain enoyl-CoA hydratase n=1 Tax=Bradyrhizobium canariense TaxID=255045 RepID=A0A1H1T7Y7_9BRAD|nr:enoyl-CoA hydratase-related protein [Bradyrhizobium canariense]SDS56380.1 short chain enoyl-CoA hydratase [Bradyrhizobium canariense]
MTEKLDRYETLRLESPSPGVLVVRFNRPEVRNAISTKMGHEMVDLFTGLNADPSGWRCVVLTGSGDRAFCAGVDLKERRGMSDETWNKQHALFERMMLGLLDCPLPIIAAVNGAAYAGGCEFMLLCDFAYAVPTARFALTEVTIGIMPGGGGTQTLPRRIGYARAAEVIMTGEPVSAEQALAWGMVNRLCSPETLMEEVLATGAKIARNAPLSIRQAKRAMTLGGRMDLRSALFFEIDAYNQLVGTEDRREGIAAFNEKRSPAFKGR